MKTRDEMIYDFMLALVQNPNILKPLEGDYEISSSHYDLCASDVYEFAAELAVSYLNNGEMK
jgi:hypothetical protein